jgi:superfamily II DNA helicase RecQ
MALTATANPRVVKDVVYGVLNMRDPVIIKTSSNRPNLHYAVLPKPRGTADAIIRWIVENHYGQAGIVYTLSRVKCEELADKLQAGGIKARHYHARISQSDKENVARGWQKGDIQVIVATVSDVMRAFSRRLLKCCE